MGNDGMTLLLGNRLGETTGVALEKIVETEGEVQNEVAAPGVEETSAVDMLTNEGTIKNGISEDGLKEAEATARALPEAKKADK